MNTNSNDFYNSIDSIKPRFESGNGLGPLLLRLLLVATDKKHPELIMGNMVDNSKMAASSDALRSNDFLNEFQLTNFLRDNNPEGPEADNSKLLNNILNEDTGSNPDNSLIKLLAQGGTRPGLNVLATKFPNVVPSGLDNQFHNRILNNPAWKKHLKGYNSKVESNNLQKQIENARLSTEFEKLLKDLEDQDAYNKSKFETSRQNVVDRGILPNSVKSDRLLTDFERKIRDTSVGQDIPSVTPEDINASRYPTSDVLTHPITSYLDSPRATSRIPESPPEDVPVDNATKASPDGDPTRILDELDFLVPNKAKDVPIQPISNVNWQNGEAPISMSDYPGSTEVGNLSKMLDKVIANQSKAKDVPADKSTPYLGGPLQELQNKPVSTKLDKNFGVPNITPERIQDKPTPNAGVADLKYLLPLLLGGGLGAGYYALKDRKKNKEKQNTKQSEYKEYEDMHINTAIGFIKAAQDHGLTQGEALDLFQKFAAFDGTGLEGIQGLQSAGGGPEGGEMDEAKESELVEMLLALLAEKGALPQGAPQPPANEQVDPQMLQQLLAQFGQGHPGMQQ